MLCFINAWGNRDCTFVQVPLEVALVMEISGNKKVYPSFETGYDIQSQVLTVGSSTVVNIDFP